MTSLYIDPGYNHYSPETGLSIALGADPAEIAAEIELRREEVEYAASIGLVLLRGSYDPGADYAMRGKALTDDAQHALIRSEIPDILIPESRNFAEYSQNPFYPAVAKGQQDRGMDKYLIDGLDSWHKIQTLLTGEGPLRDIDVEDWRGYEKAVANLAGTVPGSENEAHYKATVSAWEKYFEKVQYPLRGYDFTDWMKFDEFIPTPSDRFSSFRVIATASGALIASSLLYSGEVSEPDAEIEVNRQNLERLGTAGSNVTAFLTTPGSLVYLGTTDVRSNRTMGGNSIVLDPTENSKPRTRQDEAILEAHGLDPRRPALPDYICDRSIRIARLLGPSSGIAVGIDWLHHDENNNYYFLESNASPGTGAYVDAVMGGSEAVDELAAQRALRRAVLDSLVA